MYGTAGGKIYFRPLAISGKIPGKEYAYTTSNEQIKYHQRLLGNRHLSLANRTKAEKIKWKKEAAYKAKTDEMRSLYALCMDYITCNLHLVASFNGLPSLIGEEIFKACLNNGQFSVDEQGHDTVVHNMDLFCEAYGSGMFHSINLSGKCQFLSCYLELISVLLPYLTTVQLCGCGIGDNHEVLFHLGRLHGIKNINLKGNDLGDAGITNLLQSHRRARCGLEGLTILDISHNYRLTAACLSHLQTLPSLEAISVNSKDAKTWLCYRFSMKCREGIDHSVCFDKQTLCETMADGWGTPVLSHWLQNFKLAETNKVEKINKKLAEKIPVKAFFYKNNRNINLEKKNKILPDAWRQFQTFIFCLCGSNNTKLQNATKRKLSTLDEETSGDVKRKRFSDFLHTQESEFNELFGIYKQ